MAEDTTVPEPRPGPERGQTSPDDPRVSAVLEVLAGGSLDAVARKWAVETVLLERWVAGFVDAGTAQVTNRPDVDAARQRDLFLAALAHELRTPLAVSRGWLDMLNEEEPPTGMAAAYLTNVEKGLNRLGERILDLELLATASMGRLVLAPELLTVQELSANLAGLEIVGGDGAEVAVRVDPVIFPRILRDLWEAAALPPVPRSRHVEVWSMGPWVEIRIVREGDPISQDVLRALFAPFEHNSDETGITIGLYAARALTVAHAGTVGIAQDENGAAFWVRVPSPPAAASR